MKFVLSLFVLSCAVFSSPVFAEESVAQNPAAAAPAAAAAVPAQDPATLDQRVALAKRWHELMPVPVRDQVNGAIDEVANTQPENEREIFRANMRNALNYQALEKISIDAMAEIYTVPELQARVDYYSKPEAQSAAKKDNSYAEKIYPEIIRMLDKAIMQARTGGTGQ